MKVLKKLGRAVLFVLLLIAFYFVSAIVLTYIPVNTQFKPASQNGIQIYIKSNGVHTDIVLPQKTEQMYWNRFLDATQTKTADSTFNYVAFGWGDKGFYLNTKTWADLKLSTAFNAVFYRSTSAMHVTYYRTLQEGKKCVPVMISESHYLELMQYIKESFATDSSGHIIPIKNAGYYEDDCFYEAKGTYGLFNTCNTWANAGLKRANMKACLWTPFSFGILAKYK